MVLCAEHAAKAEALKVWAREYMRQAEGEKKMGIYIVTDSDYDRVWARGDDGQDKRQFASKDEAVNAARNKAQDNEADYYVFQAVAAAKQPKTPVEVIDIAA